MRLVSIPGSCQLFIGHTNAINKAIFSTDNKKIYTAGGSEGIFEWEFLGDVHVEEQPSEEEMVSVEKLSARKHLLEEEV